MAPGSSSSSSSSSKKRRRVPGGYERYYGYRRSPDPRLALLEGSWFRGNKVKDIGCNSGQLTLELGRLFEPRFLVGVDADRGLVRDAQRSLQRASAAVDPAAEADGSSGSREEGVGVLGRRLPFPHGVWFETDDYARPRSDAEPEDHSFDVVCAFSVTKWIHLQAGDAGLRLFFRRVHAELKPGGRFVFEPQDWKSYRRAKVKNSHDKDLTDTFRTINLRPNDFSRILVDEVGFTSVTDLGVPDDPSVPGGFRRHIYCAQKKQRTIENVAGSSVM